MIHHHHADEEELYFPEIEKRLGIHSMGPNVDQHNAFLPPLSGFEEYAKDIKEGRIPYRSEEFLERANTFAEPLVEHLYDVRASSYLSLHLAVLHLLFFRKSKPSIRNVSRKR